MPSTGDPRSGLGVPGVTGSIQTSTPAFLEGKREARTLHSSGIEEYPAEPEYHAMADICSEEALYVLVIIRKREAFLVFLSTLSKSHHLIQQQLRQKVSKHYALVTYQNSAG